MPLSETDRQPKPAEDDKAVLTSWKEIAAQLQVSVKMAQRYETELGLPVRRLAGRVSIPLSDLLHWQAENAKASPWWMNVRILQIGFAVSSGLLLVVLASAAVYLIRQLPGAPASVLLDAAVLTVRDAAGRPVWRHQFPHPLFATGEPPGLTHTLADIDHDGTLETIGVWQHVQRDTLGWDVHCFSADGKLRWLLHLDDRVKTAGGKEFGAPYVVRHFLLFESPERDGTKWVAAAFVNVAGFASTLVVVDSHGKRRGQYWHSGHLNSLQLFDADADGANEIVAGGYRLGADQAVIIAFDPARVDGANPMPESDPRRILGKAPSSEKLTGFLARSVLSQQQSSFNFIPGLSIVNGDLHAQVYESLQMQGYLTYEFKPGLRNPKITMSVAFTDASHRLALQQNLSKLIPEKEVERLQSEFRVVRP